MRDELLSCGVECYHVGWTVIMWDEMLSCGVECYHVGSVLSCGGQLLSCGINVIMWGYNVIMWDQCYHVGPNVIMWDEMLSFGMNCYHVGSNVIMWDVMLSFGIKCYHVGSNVIMWDQCYHVGVECYHVGSMFILLFSILFYSMLSCFVIIWCYHVMLSWGMITPPHFIFPENFTDSYLPFHPSIFLTLSPLCISRRWALIAANRGERVYPGSYNLQRDVVYLCWPIAPLYTSPNAGEWVGGSYGVSASEYSSTQ